MRWINRNEEGKGNKKKQPGAVIKIKEGFLCIPG